MLSIDLIKDSTKQQVSNLFKAMGDPTRISILYVLKKSELTVTQIVNLLNMSQSSISHQLRILRDSKLVTAKKVGKEVYYKLQDHHVYSIFLQAIEHVEE